MNKTTPSSKTIIVLKDLCRLYNIDEGLAGKMHTFLSDLAESDIESLRQHSFRRFLNLHRMDVSVVDTYAKLSFAELVNKGNYHWIDSRITEKNFLLSRQNLGLREFRLFDFGRKIVSSKYVEDEMRKEDFVPAGTLDGLLFGIHFPNFQKDFPIAILGSGEERVICLCTPPGKKDRRLRTSYKLTEWHKDYRFLGVLKS